MDDLQVFIVNGFLGSGKTTAIANACTRLAKENVRTAVITNDQGLRQVDTVFIKSFNVSTRQVSNGCFCCRFDEFEQTVMSIGHTDNPEIIFAESVGSCTDLIATVVKPLHLHHKEIKTVVSVFADAYLLLSIIRGRSLFVSEPVQYIYQKQLEEAEILVINKTDLLNDNELTEVKDTMAQTFPYKRIITQNSFNTANIDTWLQALRSYAPTFRRSLDIDYEKYGDGESMLAWLDRQVSIHTKTTNAVEVALELTREIHDSLKRAGLTVGHLKFMLSSDKWHKKVSYVLVENEHNYDEQEVIFSNHVDMLINARIQCVPGLLENMVDAAIETITTNRPCRLFTHHTAVFTPGYPSPTNRII